MESKSNVHISKESFTSFTSVLMTGPLDGYGQAGANDGQVAVYFHHHNGLIPPDFSDGSESIS